MVKTRRGEEVEGGLMYRTVHRNSVGVPMARRILDINMVLRFSPQRGYHPPLGRGGGRGGGRRGSGVFMYQTIAYHTIP